MAKQYALKFGSGNPINFSGLSPTFTLFAISPGGVTLSPPGVTEFLGSGLYNFTYGPTVPIIFIVDGGSSLTSTDRYIAGILDPIQSVDEKVGTLSDSYGSTSVDPTTLLGYAKRNQEFEEGDSTFDKASGTWVISSRGSSQVLRTKILSNSTGSVNKSGQ